MGLDMYLYRYPKSKTRKQIDKESEDLWKKGIDEWESGFKDVYQVAYWRKVNFLHGWIVRNLADGVDECQEIQIGKEDFETLHELVEKACNIILKSNLIPQKNIAPDGSWEAKYVNDDSKPIIPVRWNDKGKEFDGIDEDVTYKLDNDACDKLSEILPFEGGFFFGSYIYGLCYARNMLELRETVAKILEDYRDDYDYVYKASW